MHKITPLMRSLAGLDPDEHEYFDQVHIMQLYNALARAGVHVFVTLHQDKEDRPTLLIPDLDFRKGIDIGEIVEILHRLYILVRIL